MEYLNRIKSLYLNYGFKNTAKAILNKLLNKPLLYGIENDLSMCNFSVSNSKNNKKTILFVSNELNPTGAPIALLNVIKIIHKINKYNIIVLSFLGGSLISELSKLPNVQTIIMPKAINKPNLFFDVFKLNIDIIFANTIVSYKFVDYVQTHTNAKIHWWIHEGPYHQKNSMKDFKAFKIKNKTSLYAVSKIADECVKLCFKNADTKILPLALSDLKESCKEKPINNNKIEILLIGVISKRKGYDLFLKAYGDLDKDLKDRVHITIIGKASDDFKSLKKIKKDSNIKYIDKLKHNETLDLINASNLLIIPSREETFSIVGVEAIMMNTSIICSNKIGLIEYFNKNQKENIVYDFEDVVALKNLIIKFIQNPCFFQSFLPDLKQICLKNFSSVKLEENIKKIL